MRSSRSVVLGAALLAVALIGAACKGGQEPGGGGKTKGTVTVGAVAFAENQIVAEMYAQVLENAGYTVERKTTLDSREILNPAMERGDIDLAPEYLSSLLLFLDPKATASGDPDEVRSALEPLVADQGLALLASSDASDTNALVVTQETADRYGLQTTSDLADVAGDLTLGGPPECPKRPFCIPGFKDTYGIEFGDFKPLDVGGPLTVKALEKGDVDVALLFSTDATIADKGWVVLEDDQHLQNAENITPLVSQDLSGELGSLLDPVSAALTTENITELNGRVALENEDPADVARQFLTDQGLL